MPDVKRLLGKEGDYGKDLGLDNEWAYRIVKQVGNYGEIFDRNVGAGSRIKIDRGPEQALEGRRAAVRAAGPLSGAS